VKADECLLLYFLLTCATAVGADTAKAAAGAAVTFDDPAAFKTAIKAVSRYCSILIVSTTHQRACCTLPCIAF
jgi:polygalacturonase